MRNITLISTYHEEKGLCSVAELHQILERARPEVIFLEIPPSCFGQFFEEKTRSNLESDAVNRYLETHSATEPVLVDVYEAPNDLIAAHEHLHREVSADAAKGNTSGQTMGLARMVTRLTPAPGG